VIYPLDSLQTHGLGPLPWWSPAPVVTTRFVSITASGVIPGACRFAIHAREVVHDRWRRGRYQIRKLDLHHFTKAFTNVEKGDENGSQK